jgi:hypothetical protein
MIHKNAVIKFCAEAYVHEVTDDYLLKNRNDAAVRVNTQLAEGYRGMRVG